MPKPVTALATGSGWPKGLLESARRRRGRKIHEKGINLKLIPEKMHPSNLYYTNVIQFLIKQLEGFGQSNAN